MYIAIYMYTQHRSCLSVDTAKHNGFGIRGRIAPPLPVMTLGGIFG